MHYVVDLKRVAVFNFKEVVVCHTPRIVGGVVTQSAQI